MTMSLQSFRKRTLSSFSGKKKNSCSKPIPPPRSLPTTFRKPRKNVGDVVFISSTSKVYLEFKDDNYNYACLRRQNVPLNDEAVENKCELIYVNVLDDRTRGNVPTFKNKFYIGALESQEISCYIGKVDLYYFNFSINCAVVWLQKKWISTEKKKTGA
ncbi:hypothetical protein AMK59_1026 [Oryctes borbonicus]|uniref:Uncharacterized protein n=1 Tax=Oryctes borbonicus TaxID=1629725 RepID=A0A0T6BC63_9SCAR|nr:hypothetical protein AMK59_1026 [Oryctes borbonicus]